MSIKNEHPLEYKSWLHMKSRCYCETNPKYPGYGGRGIEVCGRWRDDFAAFFEDMGPRPSDRHSIDRIDNDGNYTPENCQWTTDRQQANNRRSSRTIVHDGEELTIAQWSRRTGIKQHTIRARIEKGWDIGRALSEQPVAVQPVMLTYAGRTLHLAEWARELGMNKTTLYERVNRGWSVDRVLSGGAA